MNILNMMKRLGIRMREISAEEVIIKSENEIIIKEPQINVLEYGTEKFYIISGKEELGVSEEDIRIVMEKTGKSREEVIEALRKSGGDLIEAIELLGG